MTEGPLADLNNIGNTRMGGSCTAAAFLQVGVSFLGNPSSSQSSSFSCLFVCVYVMTHVVLISVFRVCLLVTFQKWLVVMIVLDDFKGVALIQTRNKVKVLQL